jgi:GNAT superfamily N-acetyltransferase
MEVAMASGAKWRPLTRIVRPNELGDFREHLLRLDPASLHARFGRAVTTRFLEDYAARAVDLQTVVCGCYVDSRLRGVGELRAFGDTLAGEAEAAFTVERPWQDKGMGTALMARVISEARSTLIASLYVYCELRNRPMRRVAKKFGATIEHSSGEVVARIAVAPVPQPSADGAPPLVPSRPRETEACGSAPSTA